MNVWKKVPLLSLIFFGSATVTLAGGKIQGTIKGSLLDSKGSPASGISLTLCRYVELDSAAADALLGKGSTDAGRRPVMVVKAKRVPKSKTDANGMFVLRSVPAGQYAVTLADGPPCSGTVQTESNAPVKVTIDQPGQEVDLGTVRIKSR